MKNSFLLTILLSAFLLTSISFAQLTGTKNIPGDFNTLQDAITALNSQGVGSGGVTLNLIAGNPQTTPVGGYSITASGTESNPIILQGNGNIITAFSPQVTGGRLDAFIKLIGADYVTIDNFVLNENALNTTITPASNNVTEFGVALFYANTLNGAQHNTVKNCNISLIANYRNTAGIYSNCNHSSTIYNSAVSSSTLAGRNTGLTLIGNTISNAASGIVIIGSINEYYSDEDLVINSNKISNFGGTIEPEFFPGIIATVGVSAIKISNIQNYEITNNTITSNSSTVTTPITGILVSGCLQDYSIKSQKILNNRIVVRSSKTNTVLKGIYIGNEISGGDSLNISNNIFGSGFGNNTTTTSGTVSFIQLANPAYSFIDIIGNYFDTLTVKTTGVVYLIDNNSRVYENLNISYNAIRGSFSKSAGGFLYFIRKPSNSGTEFTKEYFTNNDFSNVTVSGNTQISGLSIYGYQSYSTMDSLFIRNNTLSNITAGSGKVSLISLSEGYSVASSNTISNVSSNGELNGIETIITNYEEGYHYIYLNEIRNLSSSGSVSGIKNFHYRGTSKIFENTIYGLENKSTIVPAEVNGVLFTTIGNLGGTSPFTCDVYQNKIYNIFSPSTNAIVSGVRVKSVKNLKYTINAYNNLIGDLKAPNSTGLNSVNGFLLEDDGTYNIHYNNVYLNASSNSLSFGTSCVTFSKLAAQFLCTNNIFINNSIPAQFALNNPANGISAVIRRSSGTAGEAPSNYSINSDNNNFWINTALGSNIALLFVDSTTAVTNPINSIAGLKSFLVNREKFSISENPAFLSFDGSQSNFLHINPAIATGLESNGKNISSTTTDFDSELRNIGITDIGADEFNGTGVDINPPLISYISLVTTGSYSNRTIQVPIKDAAGINTTAGSLPRIYYKRSTDDNTFIDNTNLTNGWKFTEAANSVSPFNFTIDYSLLYNGSGVSGNNTIQYFVIAMDLTDEHLTSATTGTVLTAALDTISLNSSHFPAAGTIASYLITNQSLSGDYTVGNSAFKSLSGRDITFQKVMKKKLLEVDFLESEQSTTGSNIQNNNQKKMTEVDVEELIPYENGIEYKGDLFIKKSENPQLIFPHGINGVYATLTAAVNDLNLRGISGATRFLLTDASYSSETLPITVKITNEFVTNASNTLTIKPNSGVNAIISGSNSQGIIKIDGVDFVTINGSNSNGVERNLTVQNDYFYASNSYIIVPVISVLSSGINKGAVNNTIKNCIIRAQNNYNQLIYCGIFAGNKDNNLGLIEGNDNDSLTIDNNLIQKAISAIVIRGKATGYSDYLKITNNIIGSDDYNDYVRNMGIDISYCTNSNISYNTIYNLFTPKSANKSSDYDARYIFGIRCFGITNSNIHNNQITSLGFYGTFGYYGSPERGKYFVLEEADGININTTSLNSNVNIYNNSIANLKTSKSFGYIVYDVGKRLNAGIRILGESGGVNIYYNSIGMNGESDLYDYYSYSSGIYFNSKTGVFNIQNNVFSNTISNKNNSDSRSYGLYSEYPLNAGSIINNNIYHVNDFQGVICGANSIDYSTISQWSAATGQDANSISANPLFQSDYNLRLKSGSSAVNAGIPITGITDDISGNLRNSTTPTLGAYELHGNIGPAIQYVELQDTINSNNRNLHSVSITDVDGIASGGFAPRVYWKVKNDLVWQSSATSSTSNPFSFTIGTTGFAKGDTIYYFIIAQDAAGNVSASRETGISASDVNSISAYPDEPAFYEVLSNYNYGGGKTENGGYFFANSTDFANGSKSKPIYNWIDPIAEGHTSIGASLNDYRSYTLPFSFNYFGAAYNDVFVHADGFLFLDYNDEEEYSEYSTGNNIPTLSYPFNRIMGFWNRSLIFDKLDYPNSGVYYSSNSSRFVVTYYRVYLKENTYPFHNQHYITFQIILKSDGNIKFQYNDAESNLPVGFDDFAVGIQNRLYDEGDEEVDGDEILEDKGVSYRFFNRPNGGPIFGSPLALEFGLNEEALPVELKSFTALAAGNNEILLNWVTISENNTFQFVVERKNLEQESWLSIGNIAASGNSNTIKNYSYLDKKSHKGKVSYRLKIVDSDGSFTYSTIVEVEAVLPAKFELSQNYPNPFNPSTKIRYSIPVETHRDASLQAVTLKVYDILGNEIVTLVNEKQEPGYYEVDMNSNSISGGLATGVYIYRLTAGDFVSSKKMIILK